MEKELETKELLLLQFERLPMPSPTALRQWEVFCNGARGGPLGLVLDHIGVVQR